MQRFFVDTSAWYALIDAADPDHAAILKALKAHESRLVTTNFIFDETVTLLRYRLGWQYAHQFGLSCLNGELAHTIRITPKDEEAAWRLFCDYDDKAFSFTDCTSFTMMRRLSIATAIAVDEDFRRFGLQCIP